jgi:hypothetical protein
MEFHPVPGFYILPFGEGEFTISRDQTVTMTARMNGHPYRHPNTRLCNKSGLSTIDLGWLHYVYGAMPYTQYEFIIAPKLSGGLTRCSV